MIDLFLFFKLQLNLLFLNLCTFPIKNKQNSLGYIIIRAQPEGSVDFFRLKSETEKTEPASNNNMAIFIFFCLFGLKQSFKIGSVWIVIS